MFLKKLIIGFVATAIPSFAQGKILVVGGTQTNQKNLAAYTQDFIEEEVFYYFPNTNPFTADHESDYQELYQTTLDFVGDDLDLKVISYSVGSKFAARLAEDLDAISQLVLLDPVDGPPPGQSISDRFPLFTKGNSTRNDLSVVIVATELGAKGGFLGVPCVSREYGPGHFNRFYKEVTQTELFTIRDAGHTDILYPPLKFLTRSACKKGNNAQAARENINRLVNQFLLRSNP